MPKQFHVVQPVSRGVADVTVDGTDIDGNEWSETFVASRDIPAGVIFGLTEMISRAGDGLTGATPMAYVQKEAVYSFAAVNRFMDQVLVDDDNRTRWHLLIADPKKLLPIETATGIVMYLAEELTGRPTGPASDSPAS